MTHFIKTEVIHHMGVITLDRPKTLHSLSLDMIRSMTQTLLTWQQETNIHAVLIKSSTEKAFCSGGDIRFFYDAGTVTPKQGSALLEDFFTEEYTLNHLIHHYPKPYIALMDGIIMGGGMGIAQGGEKNRIRMVTERTKMAMPEVNIGLFPDVGGSYFLSRVPGQLGTYLALTGESIQAADALHTQLADLFIPSEAIGSLLQTLNKPNLAIRETIYQFAEPFQSHINSVQGELATHQKSIDQHFAHNKISSILASLEQDTHPFAQKTLAAINKRSPIMVHVTLAQLRRATSMTLAECLRMERTMVRRNFEHGECIEGIRALIIDKDNQPLWNPPNFSQVTPEMTDSFFVPAWPDHAHPLKELI